MNYINSQTLISCIIIVILYSVFIWLYIYNSSKSNKAMVYVLFASYLIGYLYLTFLNRHSGKLVFRLDPFGDIFKSIKSGRMPYEPLLNVLLYIPFGMTLPLFSAKEMSYKHMFFIGMGLAFSTEALQLITRHGEFATKDILMNTLGAILGLLIYKKVLERI